MARSDAEKNRATILRAALASEPDASLNAIAKAAGVGIGTLYRHFPTREALLVAAYESDLYDLVAEAPKLLATKPPFDALQLWLDRLAKSGRAKVQFGALLNALPAHDRLTAASYQPIISALTQLLDANKLAGEIRSDVDPDDLLLMLGFLWRVEPSAKGHAQAKRMLAVVLAGLRRSENME